jgi:hypothetical protein
MAAQAKNMIDQEMDGNKFDRRTHIWDSQGRLIKTQLYVEYVRDGNRYIERPINSGNLWTEDNQPAGRVEKTYSAKGTVLTKSFDYTVPHKEFKPELTGDEALMYQLENEREETARLKAELAAIKAEQAPKETKPAPAPLAQAYVEAKPQYKAEPQLRKGN